MLSLSFKSSKCPVISVFGRGFLRGNEFAKQFPLNKKLFFFKHKKPLLDRKGFSFKILKVALTKKGDFFA